MTSDEEGICYVVQHETGCSCCRQDNYIEGPWRTREAAQARADEATANGELASQYQPNGLHTVEEVEFVRVRHVLILRHQVAIVDGFIEDGERFDHIIPYLPYC